jgi:Fic family protein
MYIWARDDWPHFRWDELVLKGRLDAVRVLQGRLLGRTEVVSDKASLDVEMDALIQNAIRTSEIEGEHLDVGSVRSSVARHLGLEQAGVTAKPTAQSDALVELLLEATREPDQPLTLGQLCKWQALLFPEGPGLLADVGVGKLRGNQPMQVVSGRFDLPRVHFEAPPRERLDAELDAFLDWFNQPPKGLDPLLRAGLAHLWLVTLHPFDDGNGRVTRAVTDRALAQAERQSVRFYSLSAAIMARRQAYYDQLEQAQKGSLDVTQWFSWFLEVLEEALLQALNRVARVLEKSRFWLRHATTVLSERQIKVLNRLLDSAGESFGEGINATKYKSIAKVSKATATRDLAELLEKGCLRKLPGGGRSTRYVIALASSQEESGSGEPKT